MKRLGQFCLVGASGVVGDMGVLSVVAHLTPMPLVFAKATACALAIVNNFVWNDLWTFHGDGLGTSRSPRFVRFNGIALAGLALNVVLFQVQVEGLGLNLYLANAVAIGLVAGFNYTLSRHWAWRVRTRYSCPTTMKLVGRDSVDPGNPVGRIGSASRRQSSAGWHPSVPQVGNLRDSRLAIGGTAKAHCNLLLFSPSACLLRKRHL